MYTCGEPLPNGRSGVVSAGLAVSIFVGFISHNVIFTYSSSRKIILCLKRNYVFYFLFGGEGGVRNVCSSHMPIKDWMTSQIPHNI